MKYTGSSQEAINTRGKSLKVLTLSYSNIIQFISIHVSPRNKILREFRHSPLLKLFRSQVHIFIHCEHLCSASSSGITQKRSQHQRDWIVLYFSCWKNTLDKIIESDRGLVGDSINQSIIIRLMTTRHWLFQTKQPVMEKSRSCLAGMRANGTLRTPWST